MRRPLPAEDFQHLGGLWPLHWATENESETMTENDTSTECAELTLALCFHIEVSSGRIVKIEPTQGGLFDDACGGVWYRDDWTHPSDLDTDGANHVPEGVDRAHSWLHDAIAEVEL